MFNTRFCCMLRCAILLLLLSGLDITEAFSQINSIRSEATIGGPLDESSNGFLIATDNYLVTATDSDKGNFPRIDSIGGLVTCMDQNKKILWERFISWGGAYLRVASFIATRDHGFVLLTKLNIDPGTTLPNYMLHKLDANGQTIWEKFYNPVYTTEVVDIAEADNGDFVLISYKQIPTGDRLNPYQNPQLWMEHVSADGILLHEKQLTNNHNHTGFDLKKSPDGNFIAVGTVTDFNDLANIGGARDAFILKFRIDGTVLWNKYFGGEHFVDILYEVTIAPDNSIIAAGASSSKNLYGSRNQGYSDGWLLKLSPSGELVWNKLIGGSETDYLYNVELASDGSIVGGGQTSSSDGQLSDNVYKETTWLTKVRENSPLVENGYFADTYGAFTGATDVAVTRSGKTFFVATSDENNIRKSKSNGRRDLWVVETGVSNEIRMEAFIDANSNSQKDLDENIYATGKLHVRNINNGEIQIKLASNNSFLSYLDSGSYEFRFVPELPYYLPQPAQVIKSYSTQSGRDTIYFAVQPIAGNKDLTISIIPPEFARPGFEGNYQLIYTNTGTEIISHPSVRFIPSAKFIPIATTPAFALKRNDTLVWNLPSIKPMEKGFITIKGNFAEPPSLNFGDSIFTRALIDTVGSERNIDDNLASLIEIARGSFDPNDKTEFHGGIMPVDNLSKERLVYLVRFQNTGTDTAFNIKIRDTLDSRIDWTSLKMINASHSYTLKIKNHNQLEWHFSNIVLPDSNRNESASNGYVLYSVKAKPGLKVGDEITNSASIYFDFNEPVITNKTVTRVGQILSLPKPILSGLANEYCGASGIQNIQISNSALAAPATITVLLNNKSIPVTSAGIFQITPNSLIAGIQQLIVSFSSGGANTKLGMSFNINQPVTPNVKLNSNLSTVNNGTTAVLFSASNISGGGAAPLYTFSATRNFTGILQAESPNNSLAIMSQILNAGDNWIYVRMRTSENCYTTMTSVDSVKLVKTAVTSVVDLNFPDAKIIAYPNPGSSKITVKGLQSFKQYQIQLLNTSGHIVETNTVTGSTTSTLSISMYSAGAYLIRIYNNQRLIGTIPVIKL